MDQPSRQCDEKTKLRLLENVQAEDKNKNTHIAADTQTTSTLSGHID
jgi:hypothetical protein